MRFAALLFATLIAAGRLEAQFTPPVCPAGPYPHANTCANACVHCGSLSGMTSATAMVGQGQLVPGFCTMIVHSMKYICFIAGSTDLSLNVTVNSCSLGNGIEMGIYDSPDCSTFNLVSNCNTQMNVGQTFPFSTTEPLHPGCQYYLIFDNNGPAACSFTIQITSGSTGSPDLGAPPLPEGPAQFCPGAALTYSIPPQPFACDYEWTAPPGATINGLPSPQTIDWETGTSVSIKFGDQPGNVCVRSKNPCKTSPWSCRAVTLKTVPPTLLPPAHICQGEGYEWLDGNIYSSAQLLSYTYQTPEGCDSVVKRPLQVSVPKLTNLGPQYVCQGECVTIAGLTACAQGLYDTTLVSAAGCDSVVRFGVVVIPAKAQIKPVGDTLDCLTSQILLDGHGSIGDTWKWFGPSGAMLGSDTTQVAIAPGPFKLVLETTAFGKTCRDTAQRVVHQSVSHPAALLSASQITCSNPLSTISATTNPPDATRLWQGPNGFSSTAQSPTVGQPGLYFLTLTDPANGCTGRDSILVSQNTVPPTFFVNSALLTCLQSTANLAASSTNPSLTFQWVENQTVVANGPSFSTQNPASLTVVATDPANGCTASIPTEVSQNQTAPTFSVNSATLTCFQPTANLAASSSNLNLNFQWIENQTVVATGSSFSTQNPASLTVVATDPANGCTASQPTEVLQNQTPPIFSVNNFTLSCSMPTASLTASSSNPNLTFQWVENQTVVATGPSFSTQSAGSFEVVATDPANGCTAAQTATVAPGNDVPQIALAAPPDTLTCVKNSTQFGVNASPAGLTFFWQSANGQGISGSPTGQNLTVIQPGLYTLTATHPASQCTASLSVQVFENKKIPPAEAGPSQLLTCLEFQKDATLGAAGTNNSLIFNWIGPGISPSNMASPQPVVDKPGDYFLTVTDPANGCSAIDSTVVNEDKVPPEITIEQPDTLDCSQPQITIHGSCIATHGFVDWSWLTKNGLILAGGSSSNCIISLLGEYTAFVFDPWNGCVDSATISVLQNIKFPAVEAGPPVVLTCKNPTLKLNGSGATGPGVEYLWTTTDGQILADTAGLHPTVGKAGSYVLTVLDTKNGCFSMDTTTVSENFTAPAVDAGAALTLDCASVFANLGGSSIPGATVKWTTVGGHFLDLPTQLSPKIDAPGWYFLTATDPSNGCTARDSVLVSPDADAPTVSIAPPEVFTCKMTTVVLSATVVGNSPSPVLSYNWTTSGGQILNGATTLNPETGKPGTYILTVIDAGNGCSTVASVVATSDYQPPVITVATPAPLSCDVLTTTLSATVTTASGGGFSFEWLSIAPILSGANTLTPTVGEKGTYQIIATDLSNGCTAIKGIAVGQQLISQHLVVIKPAAQVDCAHPTVELEALLSFSGPGFTLAWSTDTGSIVSGGTALKPVVASGGTYTMIIKDLASGCLDTVSILVKEDFKKPTIDIAQPEILNCLKTSAPLVGNGIGQGQLLKKWTTVGGFFSGPTNQFTAIAGLPGGYFLELTDPANGCTARDSVEVLGNFEKPVVSIKADSITCPNPVATLAAVFQNPNLNFEWVENLPGGGSQPVANQPIFSTPNPGSFTLTATDPANGCTAIDTVIVTKHEPISGVSLDIDLPPCFDGSGATLTVGGVAGSVAPVEFSIDNQPFSSKNNWPGLPPGDYLLKIRDAAGCTFDSLVAVAAPADWQIEVGPDTTIVIGEKALLTMTASPVDVFLEKIKWEPQDKFGPCDTCRARIVAPKHDRWFWVVATDPFGCTRVDSVLVKVLYPEIYVPNVFVPGGSGGNEIFKGFYGPGVVEISRFAVFTRWGDQVHLEKDFLPTDAGQGWDGRFRGKFVEDGVYVWWLEAVLAGGQTRFLKGDVTVAR